ncbi:hypothetical protein AB5I39_13515 [Sphingomonas sp. MMS24-J45]|uniref:hypothetical protein n=1 Tax=Sphingomonas sp. MMS24-J45 TaxID=3238806 RepID=UPI0038517E7D
MRRPLVLAIGEGAFRGVLAAHLTLHNHMPIICTDHLDPALGPALRGSAILVIEETLIAAAPEQWAETLRDQCWGGALIVIVDNVPEGIRASEGVALVNRALAISAITDLVEKWQADGSNLLSRPS